MIAELTIGLAIHYSVDYSVDTLGGSSNFLFNIFTHRANCAIAYSVDAWEALILVTP
jgi:hypothetical protein